MNKESISVRLYSVILGGICWIFRVFCKIENIIVSLRKEVFMMIMRGSIESRNNILISCKGELGKDILYFLWYDLECYYIVCILFFLLGLCCIFVKILMCNMYYKFIVIGN